MKINEIWPVGIKKIFYQEKQKEDKGMNKILRRGIIHAKERLKRRRRKLGASKFLIQVHRKKKWIQVGATKIKWHICVQSSRHNYTIHSRPFRLKELRLVWINLKSDNEKKKKSRKFDAFCQMFLKYSREKKKLRSEGGKKESNYFLTLR